MTRFNFEVDESDHRKFKAACGIAGRSMVQALLQFIQACSKHGVNRVLDHLKELKR